MRSKSTFLLVLLLTASPLAFAQSTRRLAVVEANGQLARSSPIYTLAESRVTDQLTEKMTSQPGFTVVDRASVDKIIKEQNFQNSDRSSSDTAVRIGKLLGVGQIVLVNMYDASFTTHAEGSGTSTKTMGTQTLRVNVRMIDVETGVILSQPSAQFQESVLVSQSSTLPAFQFGVVRMPAKQKSSSGDPTVIMDNEWTKACDAVTTELAGKLTGSMGTAPVPKAASALVAGIANGSTYINQGTKTGVKPGDKFQVIREVSVGLNDPSTGKPIVQKQRVCVLTVVDAQDGSASGTCQGGLPQSKDLAEPM